jgi:hypothetical protein
MSKSLPKSFKLLIFVNIFFVIVSVFISFGFSFFGLGGYPPFAFLGGILLMCSMLLFLAFAVMVVIDLIFGFWLWKKVRFLVLLPLMILVICFFTMTFAGDFGRNLANIRFDKYEKVAAMIQDGSIEIREHYVTFPSGYCHLAFMGGAYVENDDPNDPNNIMIEFRVGSGGFAGHIAYVYSSTGTIDENSHMAKIWPRRKQVKKNWFRAYN